MDTKTKHRILGVLVIIGFVIILFPLFQNNKEFPKEIASVKAPPFPDQSVQVTAQTAPRPEEAREKLTQSTTKLDNVTTQQAIPIPPNMNTQLANNDTNALADTIATSQPTSRAPETLKENIQKEITQDKEKQVGMRDVPIQLENSDKPTRKAKPAIIRKTTHPIVHPIHSAKRPLQRMPLDDNGLVKLKDAVWVIQIGSFKNKANALRLVNQLRANGYNAFIQQVSTSLGNSTRVFVGPEIKHEAARALVSKLETDLHIHGIIISYKPLAL